MGMEILKRDGMKIFFYIFAFMIISISIANAAVTLEQSDLCYKYLKIKEYDKAINSCTQIIKLIESIESVSEKERSDTLARYYNNRGRAYLEKKEYDKAIVDFTKAVELDPTSFDAYSYLGVVNDSIGNYDKAIEYYTKAIELKPDDFKNYNNRAMAYYFKGDYDKAMADLMKAIELNPKDSLSYYNIACLYSIKNNIEEACNWLSKAIENGYNNWDSIKQDKDLANIRNSPCYKQIISQEIGTVLLNEKSDDTTERPT